MNKLVYITALRKYTYVMVKKVAIKKKVIAKKRGPKPKGKVSLEWSSELAYVIGLLVSDGSLSKDMRHIVFCSTDLQLITLYKRLLKLSNNIGIKKSKEDLYNRKPGYVIQFGDVIFFNFLLTIGLMPNKTKIIGEIAVPNKYYPDFLRGCFDGDGTSYSYFDKRWKSSFMFYVGFVSASEKHIFWIQRKNNELFGVDGYITKIKDKDFYQLRYAKKEGLVISEKMYYNPEVSCLLRKRKKLFEAIQKNAQVLKLVDITA